MSDEKKKTILLVEDEAILAMSEKIGLEKYGYTILVENTGEKAIDASRANNDIDLILMDIDLGKGIDGTQAAEIILKDKNIPILFLSSHIENDIVSKTEKITSYGYVVKDSNITVLNASIKMAFKLFEANSLVLEQKKRLDFALTAPNDGLWDWDILSNKAYFSPIYYTMLGYEPYEFEQNLESWRSLVHSDDIEYCESELQQAIAQKRGFDMDFRARMKNGNWKWIHGRGKVMEYDAAGNPIRMIGTHIDIDNKKRAEIELIESEERFKSTFNQSAVGIAHVGLDGRFIRLNQKFCDIVGYTYKEMIALSFQEITFPQDLAADLNAVNDLIEGKINNYVMEKRYVCKSSNIIWVRLTVSLLRKQSGEPHYFISIVEDITERKEAEDMLRNSANEWRTTFDAMENAIWLLDKQMRIVLANKATQTILKKNPSEIIGRHCWEVVHGTQHPIDNCPVMRSLLVKKRESIEFKLGDQWLEVITDPVLDEDGGINAVVHLISDITERRRAEDRIKAEEERTTLLLDLAPDAFLHGDNQGNIIGYNKKAIEMLGYSKDELLSMNIKDLIDPDTLEASPLRYDLLINGDVLRNERVMIKKNHEPIDIEMNSRVMPDGTYQSFLRDITERKKAEIEIKRQLFEKEILLKEVHHRIKNNISSIESLLSLQMSSTTNTDVLSSLQDVLARIRSIRVLYDKMLIGDDFHEASVKYYIEGLLDGIIAVFSHCGKITIKKKIKDFKLDAKNLISLGIIINEILTNIFKYAFRGKDNGQIDIVLEKIDNHVTLTIKDNGVGVDEKADKPKPKGFGLVLVKMLAEQLGGTYSIENDNGTKNVLEFNLGC